MTENYIIREAANNKTEYIKKIIPVLSKYAMDGAIVYKYDEVKILETYRIKYDDETYVMLNSSISAYLSEKWNMNLDAIGLHVIAMMNIMEDDDSTVLSPLTKIFEKNGVDIDTDSPLGPVFYVMTNKTNMFGANRILIKNALNRMYMLYNEPYYIIPSSIHEVLCIPARSPDMVEDLREITVNVNREYVEEKYQLSDDVFIFDGKEIMKTK